MPYLGSGVGTGPHQDDLSSFGLGIVIGIWYKSFRKKKKGAGVNAGALFRSHASMYTERIGGRRFRDRVSKKHRV